MFELLNDCDSALGLPNLKSTSPSEMMTIAIAFHQQRYRTFKDYYTKPVLVHWEKAFPQAVSYQRFVSWMPSVLLPLCAYLKSCFGKCTGISFIDSSTLKLCHNRRIHQHQVFAELAAGGKTSVDWFFGFKLPGSSMNTQNCSS